VGPATKKNNKKSKKIEKNLWQVDLPHVAGGTCHKKNNKKSKKT
jgi:hypothetical protein